MLYAQENFKNGYIVNLQNDTIKGQIDDRQWTQSPTTIKFKQKNIVNYTTKDIKGFYIEEAGELYVSYVGKVDNTYTKVDDMHRSGTPQGFMQATDRFREDAFFLRSVFLSSAYSLFIYTDNRNRTHYFLQQGT
jgi:hypothetical protein